MNLNCIFTAILAIFHSYPGTDSLHIEFYYQSQTLFNQSIKFMFLMVTEKLRYVRNNPICSCLVLFVQFGKNRRRSSFCTIWLGVTALGFPQPENVRSTFGNRSPILLNPPEILQHIFCHRRIHIFASNHIYQVQPLQ